MPTMMDFSRFFSGFLAAALLGMTQFNQFFYPLLALSK
jgi:hypothetical protein